MDKVNAVGREGDLGYIYERDHSIAHREIRVPTGLATGWPQGIVKGRFGNLPLTDFAFAFCFGVQKHCLVVGS